MVVALLSLAIQHFLAWLDLSGHRSRLEVMASSLVSLHVAADAERLPASLVWALEWFLACMRVTVDAQAGRSGESLVACLADVAILRLRKGCCRRGRDVVVMLPRVCARRWGESDLDWHQGWRELLLAVSPRFKFWGSQAVEYVLEEEVSGSRVRIFGIEVVLVAWEMDSKSSLIDEGRLCTESQGTATERMALTAAALRLFAAAEERVDAEREAPRC